MRSAYMASWRRLLCFAFFLSVGLVASDIRAQSASESYSADAVRAAYLVNFIRFTEWPASSDTDGPIIIGVAGSRELEDYLWKTTDGKSLNGRRVRILRLAVPNDAAQCHLIYINPTPSRAESVPVSTQEWLQAVKGRPVLTVSQLNTFLREGGIINFYTEGNRLHFEISPDAADAAGLRLSSRLLALAKVVRTEPSSPPRR